MSTESGPADVNEETRQVSCLKWTSWPVVDERPDSWLLVGAVVLVAVVIGSVSGGWVIGGVALLVLGTAMWRMWVPVTYELSSLGILESAWRRRRCVTWRQITSYRAYRRGVLLMTSLDTAPIARLRGIYVATGDYREQLLELLRRNVVEQ